MISLEFKKYFESLFSASKSGRVSQKFWKPETPIIKFNISKKNNKITNLKNNTKNII